MRKRSQFKRVAGVTGLATLALAGVIAGVFLPAGAAGTKVVAPTKVTVKASEFKYVFSRRSVPTGTVVFTVINKGKISHDFKINGKKTKSLLPGKSAKLTVKFTKKGQYAYLCTLFGHAKAGMKGKYAVATKPVATTTTKTTTPTTTTTPPPTGPIGSANTTVQVGMFEYGYNLSQQSVPSGQVTFVIRNNGSEVHNFTVQGVKVGAILNPGQTETYTVGLPPARFSYVCDVPFHIDRGMLGSLTVNP
ncbi:MAG TPA: cupredoxin domain-containing protein [Gaiellaceae bacterium]|nr:cupredoxin domain-containing protein [Gaiellaceae bacterium]